MYNSCEWIRYECAIRFCSLLLVGIFFVCRSIAASLQLGNIHCHFSHLSLFLSVCLYFVCTKFKPNFSLRCSIMRLTFTTHFIIKIIIGDRAYFALFSLSLCLSFNRSLPSAFYSTCIPLHHILTIHRIDIEFIFLDATTILHYQIILRYNYFRRPIDDGVFTIFLMVIVFSTIFIHRL